MPRLFGIWRLITVIWIVMIISPLPAVAQTSDYYPLTIGNAWTYRVTDGSHGEMKAEITSQEKVGKADCFVESYTVQGRIVQQHYLAWAGEKLLLYRTVVDGEIVNHSPPQLYLVTPLSVGQTWTWKGNLQSQTYGTYWGKISSKVTDRATITVPAGTFEAFVVRVDVESVLTGAFTGNRWFVKGLGLIREDVKTASGGALASWNRMMLGLRIKHVTFDEYGAILRVAGKTGERRVRVVSSAPLLASWLSHHPNREDHEAPLWIQSTGEPLTYDATRVMLHKRAEAAGIKKQVNPHIFRHSQASRLASDLRGGFV